MASKLPECAKWQSLPELSLTEADTVLVTPDADGSVSTRQATCSILGGLSGGHPCIRGTNAGDAGERNSWHQGEFLEQSCTCMRMMEVRETVL